MDIVKGKYYKYNDANSFTVKALDNSTANCFSGFVVLSNPTSQWELGHQSFDWSTKLFVESDLSEFLVEANTRYPIGSQYVCVGGDDLGVKGKGVAEVNYEARLWKFDNDGGWQGIEMGNFMVYNFKIDKWAKPFSNIEEEVVEEEQELFDMDTNESRLAYAKENYPIGTEIISHNNLKHIISGTPKIWRGNDGTNINIDIQCGDYSPFIFCHNKGWVQIIKKSEKVETMKKQKITRQGLKEIHSVACATWKNTLEEYGRRNPLEDYVEFSQSEVDNMFKACTAEQLPIVSKHLKQNSLKHFIKGIDDNQLRQITNRLLKVRVGGEYERASFTLNDSFDWKIKVDSFGYKCLIPTIKK